MSAKAGKAIFCEKPIDLDIKKVNECMQEIKGPMFYRNAGHCA